MYANSHLITNNQKWSDVTTHRMHVQVWRSRVEHVCRVVYLWCTNCYCSWHLWRALPYKRCAYSVHTIGGKPAYIESGARSHMAVSIM